MVEPSSITPDLRARLTEAQQQHDAGHLEAAVQVYREIIALDPGQPDALYKLGVIALQLDNLELALQLFDMTLAKSPAYAAAHINRALALGKSGRPDEALAAAEAAIAADPNSAEAWDMVACLRRDRREDEAALDAHWRALVLQPANGRFFNNFAITQANAGDYRSARVYAGQAVSLLPNETGPLMTLGNILAETGEPEQAIDCYRRVQELDPKHGQALQSEARARLSIGDLRSGWAQMQQRPLMTACNERLMQLPRWRGQRVARLLLAVEQGYGDAIMFLRYIDDVETRADKIFLVMPAPLQRLVRANYPGVTILAPDEQWPEADAYELLMSLPHHFKTELATIPAPIPYLRPVSGSHDLWSARLDSCERPRIGILWSGSPVNAADHRRSIPPHKLAPLIDRYGAHLVSLQRTGLASDMVIAGVIDAAPWIKDFADTAGLIAELDLLITIDSAAAHLAAAMGVPVWMMLAYAPDWRWLQVREDSPWYPSLRLFRQPQPGDWDAVVAAVMQRLEDLLQKEPAPLQARV